MVHTLQVELQSEQAQAFLAPRPPRAVNLFRGERTTCRYLVERENNAKREKTDGTRSAPVRHVRRVKNRTSRTSTGSSDANQQIKKALMKPRGRRARHVDRPHSPGEKKSSSGHVLYSSSSSVFFVLLLCCVRRVPSSSFVPISFCEPSCYTLLLTASIC